MQMINIHEAKTHLSRLLEQALEGEDIVIAKSGVPMVRMIPYVSPKRMLAPPGAMKGEIKIADDFDEDLSSMFDCLSER